MNDFPFKKGDIVTSWKLALSNKLTVTRVARDSECESGFAVSVVQNPCPHCGRGDAKFTAYDSGWFTKVTKEA